MHRSTGMRWRRLLRRRECVGLYLSIRRGIVFLIWRTRRPTGSCWSSSFRHSHFTLLGSQCRFRTQVLPLRLRFLSGLLAFSVR
uniref:Uncharacterized protein n=1 Tax=Helianthus annuus TaxID=4232 RepID=A0A251T0G2_HELAN